MGETWYVLENGNVADPNEVAPNNDGKLVHKSGIPVAMRGRVPSSRGVDADAERAKASIMRGEKSVNQAREDLGHQPIEPKKTKNREIKASDSGKTYETR